jgi:integrase
MIDFITSDNLPFSAPKTQLKHWPTENFNEALTKIAINCTELLDSVSAKYVEASRAQSSLKAYASDLRHFLTWGGEVPCGPELVARYIAEHGERLAPASLERRLASISVAHSAKGLPSPTRSELVRSILKGIRRTQGTAQKQAKPLLRDDLFAVLDAMSVTTAKDLRDRSLMLLGFAGGFRRSELVGLNVEDIEQVRQGMVVTLRRSKTDQEGNGRKIGIPLGRTRLCPVKALETWLQVAAISGRHIYRPIGKGGHISSPRLSGKAVSNIIRQRISDAGMEPSGYSGHSLRSGFATSAAMAGVSSWKIRQQTGHASDAMLNRYIRDGQIFEGNAAGTLL